MRNYSRKIANLLIITCVLAFSNLQAQAPLGFNYQGVALTNAGTPVASKKISLRIALIESQQLGTVIYQETHGVNTDAYGQFSVIIGNGQSTIGKMSDVQWNKYPYYMKVELDLDGGTSFVFVGTSQLLSVPYALYANNAGAASIGVDSIKNELATIKLSQKGDSIILSNNRGAVYVPKVDSLTKILAQISSIKAGTLKYIKDSITKLPNGVAIGYNALNNFDSTAFNSSNIALGQNAGVALTKQTSGVSNSDNILVGQNAAASINGTSIISGAYQNIIIGNGAGQSTNSLASQNVVIGHEAAKNSNGTIGTKTSVFNSNIAIGARSLKSAIISLSNVSIGVDNMIASTQVNRNTMIGSNAVNKYNGDDNVIIGAEMLYDSSSNGSKNVIIGSAVAKNIRGSKNIIIGYKAAYDTSFLNTNNKLIISNDSTRTPLIYGEFDNKKVTINGDFTVTGKSNLGGSSVSDSTIKVLNKRVDSLVSVISTKSYSRIDSSTLFTANPVIVTKFLDSTFLPAINFDGSKSYIQIGATGLLGTRIYGNNFSVELWMKSLKISDTIQYLYGTGYSWNGGSGNYKIGLYKGRVTVNVGNFGGYYISCDYPKDSLWHHVAFVHDNQKKVGIIYIDGIEKVRLSNLGSQSMANGTSGVEGIGTNLDLGGEPPREFFKGNIRKLRVSKGAVYTSNFTPSFTYSKSDSSLAFYELNDLGTNIKASDSAYNGTLYNGTWSISASSVSLNNGLIAYYPFTGNANDSSGNGNNGTVTGVNLTTDRFGNVNRAYEFNGIKGYPNDPETVQEIVINNKIINLSSDYTISIWMNSTNIAKVNQTIFNSIAHTGFVIELNNNNVPNKLMYGVGSALTFWDLIYASGTSASFQNNVWKHIVFVKSGSSYKLYLDGKLEGSSIVSQSSNYSESVGLRIGSTGGGNEVFKGILDDVRVYNRSLNSNEIQYLSTH